MYFSHIIFGLKENVIKEICFPSYLDEKKFHKPFYYEKCTEMMESEDDISPFFFYQTHARNNRKNFFLSFLHFVFISFKIYQPKHTLIANLCSQASTPADGKKWKKKLPRLIYFHVKNSESTGKFADLGVRANRGTS